MKFSARVCFLVLSVFLSTTVFGASDGSIRIQSGSSTTNSKSSSVTITLMTNLNAGTIVLSNLTANTFPVTDGNKRLVSATNTGSGSIVLATSPTLVTPNIGAATATTPSASDNDTSVATTAFVQGELSNPRIGSIGITIDGGGSAITTGTKGYISVPYACTINSVTMLADQSGSAVVDVWKDSYANAPPTVADTITASAKPTISSATKSTDTTLTGWTTSVSAGDVIGFNVDSAATLTRLTLVLKVTK